MIFFHIRIIGKRRYILLTIVLLVVCHSLLLWSSSRISVSSVKWTCLHECYAIVYFISPRQIAAIYWFNRCLCLCITGERVFVYWSNHVTYRRKVADFIFFPRNETIIASFCTSRMTRLLIENWSCNMCWAEWHTLRFLLRSQVSLEKKH